MKEATYEDKKGRLWRVLVPDHALDSDASLGIPIGPPSLDSLGLPEEQAVRLHNQLYHRQLFTEEDMKRRRHDVTAALFATFKVDSQKIIDLYREEEVGQ